MSPRRIQVPHVEQAPKSPPADPAVDRLRPHLEGASREELVGLIERLAGDSDELAARIDYITNQAAAATALQRRITAIRNGKRYIAYGESRHVAAELSGVIDDIRADVLPRDPEKAVALAEKLFLLDNEPAQII
jgi:hypothetical protein